ncbi:MAG: winged helix-turn-helix domain-containing protein [Rudaea sp.]|uniref:protein kinase domain-containing protein n=1 Tax=unclassified Rudaea TaxID=2627037 RepID=UPI0010F665CD|nr:MULTISPECIES: winged helix-turn-helix domain-containing protein [unclassified Rudaea]MBN8884334.1 winged helix-turn-helix domain-containing protein [Rudaea sp.]
MKNDEQIGTQTSYRYRFGTAEFDEARFELRVAGLPVEVERRALEVLAYLLRHAGEVVTKEELFREVWAGRITVDKVLPNAIAKLRRALGEANADLLLTQPRIGYRLDGTVERIAVGRTLSSKLELAPGQTVPGRPNFQLKRLLGSSRGNEVWLAEHAKTRALRVYKFCTDGERLRALKREATLARVLQEGVEDHRHFVELIDWNFETQPFFLECEYGGDNLLEWAKTSLAARGRTERLGLFLQIADAVATAHGIGVLHKDLKPANVLIAEEEAGPRVCLTDFGSGRLLDPDRLEELGITGLGLTVTQSLSADSSTGTPLYLAPEVIAGHTPTVQSDVYALGVLLYQLLAGDLSKPMASGWEADIGDDLLSDDIRSATHGNPAQRVAGAAELAGRLRNLDLRREQTARLREVQAQARLAQETLARSRAQRPYLIALVGALVLGVLVSLGLYRTASNARNTAQRELDRANAINRFLNEELISNSNPFVAAKGQSATLKDTLLGARERIAKRFASQPLTEASIRANLVSPLNMLELFAEAESEARKALALYEREEGASSLDALRARSMLARILTRTAKFDEALKEIETLDSLTKDSPGAWTKYLTSSAKGTYYANRGDYAKAVPEFKVAIAAIREVDPGNISVRDSMRMDLISMLIQTGNAKEALQEGKGVIDEIVARGGDNELVLAFAKASVAKAYAAEGDDGQAEAQLLDAQQTIVRLLGPEHTRNLVLMSDLYEIELRRKNRAKALEYAQLVYTGFRTKLGEDHNITNVTLINLGQALYENGNSVDAAARLRTAYEKLSAKLTKQNPQSQYAGFWLAAALADLGKADEAASLVDSLDQKSLELAGSPDNAWKFRIEALRGLIEMKRGNRAAAQTLLKSAIDGMKQNSVADETIYTKANQSLAVFAEKPA